MGIFADFLQATAFHMMHVIVDVRDQLLHLQCLFVQLAVGAVRSLDMMQLHVREGGGPSMRTHVSAPQRGGRCRRLTLRPDHLTPC